MGCGNSKQPDSQSIIPKILVPIVSNSQPAEIKPENPNSNMAKIDVVHIVINNPGKLIQNYTQSAKIGEGSHGFVRVAVHKASGQKRAIKSIEKLKVTGDDGRNQFLNEINILKKMDHPNIVKLYEFYEDETYFHLVTEYIAGGELFDYIIHSKMLSEPIAANFMRQILSAISYCHDNNIAHRDIKPENLLLDKEGEQAIIKIIDFGKSVEFTHGAKLKQKCGNAFYVAPEILGNSGYDEKCDVWSCGVILYILLCGKPPFYGKKDEEIVKKVLSGEYSLSGPVWTNISEPAIKLIQKMLEINPKRRISAKNALSDPWILSNLTRNKTVSDDFIPLNNLRNFHTEQRLEHAVLSFIGSNLMSKEESKKMYSNFKSIDKNNDGKLSKEELLEAYMKTMNKEDAIDEVKRIMESVDTNQSGFIDYAEFIAASVKSDHLISDENLEIAFKAFDIDGSGKITVGELKEILGVALESEDIVNRLIEKVDSNGDGEIDIKEFKQMMLHCIEA